MKKVRTKQGDVLDQIALKYLGSTSHVPEIFAVNPGLAAVGPVYQAGLIIDLPEQTASNPERVVRLWS